MIRKILRLAAVGVCAVALSGCISLLPKTKPAMLYRLAPPVAEAPAAQGQSVGVFLSSGSFQRVASGDRFLTVTDQRVAYIARARWVAPASVLFEETVHQAFDRAGGKIRLVSRGELAQSAYVLRLDVRNFETHYDQGPKAAPQVVIRVRASITRSENRTLVADQMLEATARAGDNTVSGIVGAFDKALGEVIGKLLSFVNAQAS